MFDIKVDGIDNCIEMIEKVSETENLENSMEMAALVVEKEAKINAPKVTGELRNSIASRVEGGGNQITGVIYSPLLYAPYVEYGTGLFAENGGRQDVPWQYRDEKGNWYTTFGMAPQPYLRPALLNNKKEIIKTLKEGLLND